MFISSNQWVHIPEPKAHATMRLFGSDSIWMCS